MGRQRALDTSRLIFFWRKQRGQRKVPIDQLSTADVVAWARQLAEEAGTSAILTPVAIEFLCGATSRQELELSRAFLDELDVIDGGRITPEDWENCRRYASRVPRDGARRQLGDCLIEAIARRIGCEILTSDIGLGRHSRTNDPGFLQ